MKYCSKCRRVMIIDNVLTQTLLYTCEVCTNSVRGTPEDTLLIDEELTSGDSNVQNAVLVDNAPFDAAANIQKKECPACKLPYMTMLILNEGSRIVYKCKCGHQIG